MSTRGKRTGFTLIELIIVIALAALLITMAAPGLRNFILVQRLKSVHAALVTDLQFARSEAAARNQVVWIDFRADAGQSCYTLYTAPNMNSRCNCLLGAGAACGANLVEVRTNQVLRADGVSVLPAAGMQPRVGYDPVAGGLVNPPSDFANPVPLVYTAESRLDAARILRVVLDPSGRPSVCSPSSAHLGAAAC